MTNLAGVVVDDDTDGEVDGRDEGLRAADRLLVLPYALHLGGDGKAAMQGKVGKTPRDDPG